MKIQTILTLLFLACVMTQIIDDFSESDSDSSDDSDDSDRTGRTNNDLEATCFNALLACTSGSLTTISQQCQDQYNRSLRLSSKKVEDSKGNESTSSVRMRVGSKDRHGQKGKKHQKQRNHLWMRVWLNLRAKAWEECLTFSHKNLSDFRKRRLHAFAVFCERRRREREIADGRRRQWEIKRWEEEDEIVKQILKCHQNCVDAHLEHILTTTFNEVAHEQAYADIQAQAAAIDKAAYEMEKWSAMSS